MKIACAQFDAKLGEFEKNVCKVEQLLSNCDLTGVNLLLLAEMALTGYKFLSKDEILPHLEDKNNGRSILWAKDRAKLYSCFVCIGYPEIDGDHCYNSCALISPQGELIHNYRKHYLFETDLTWASPGEGFSSIDLDPFGKLGLGICMDLNFKYSEEHDFHLNKFASFHLESKSKLVIVPMAWLLPEDSLDLLDTSSSKFCSDTLEYWCNRLSPFFDSETNLDDNPIYFVCCNRTGRENGAIYCGTSTVLKFTRNSIKVLNVMNVIQEGIMVTEIKDY